MYRSDVAMSKIMSSILLASIVIVTATTSGYWVEALTLNRIAFEQIALPAAYAEYDSGLFSNGGWNITVEMKNSGSADATIKSIFLNALSISDYAAGNIALYIDDVRHLSLSSISVSLIKGSSVRLLLQVERYQNGTGVEGCTSRTMLDLRFHTAAGMDYPLRIRLP